MDFFYNKKTQYFLKVFFSIGLFLFLLKKIELEKLFDSFLEISTFPFIIAMTAFLVGRLMLAHQTWSIIKQKSNRIRFIEILEINLASSFYSLILPGLIAGTAASLYKFSKKTNNFLESFSIIFFSRLLSMLAVLIMGLYGLYFEKNPVFINIKKTLYILVPVSLCLMFLFYCHFKKNKKSNLIKKRNNSKIDQYFKKIFSIIYFISDFKITFIFWLLSYNFVIHLLGAITLYYIFIALDAHLPATTLIWILALLNIITFLPISFAGLGVREASFVGILPIYGISSEKALAISLLIFSFSLFEGLAGGLLELYRFIKNNVPK